MTGRWPAAARMVALAVAGAAVVALMVAFGPSLTATGGRAQAATVVHPAGDDDARAVTDLPAAGADDPYHMLIDGILAALDTFWSEHAPEVGLTAIDPPAGGVIVVDSAAQMDPIDCIPTAARMVGNAIYCSSSDAIVIDGAALLPVVYHRYGPGGVITSLAHEYGHLVQQRIAPDRVAASTLQGEAGADCYAGAFVAAVVAGTVDGIHMGSAGLISTVAPLVDFADADGVPVSAPDAHGTAADRLAWFRDGMDNGVRACATVMQAHPPQQTPPQINARLYTAMGDPSVTADQLLRIIG